MAARSRRPVASSTALMVDNGSTGIGRLLSTTVSTRRKRGVVMTTRPTEPTASTLTRNLELNAFHLSIDSTRGTHVTTIRGCLAHHDAS